MGLYTISKEFDFSASHMLLGLPTGHKCSRMHGHSYRVKVSISGTLDEIGFVVDFGELDWVKELIDDRVDHRHLNDVIDANPTSENVAQWLLEHVMAWVQGIEGVERITTIQIGVSEHQRTWAYVSGQL